MTVHNRWRVWLITVLVILMLAYISRYKLERAAIAVAIYHSHAFTPPEPEPSANAPDHAEFYWDLAKLRMDREERLKRVNPQLKPLVAELRRRQAAGEGMQYSMHIYREIRWLLNFTPDLPAAQARIADLRRSLSQPGDQVLASQQSSDGSWGLGLNVWYLKLYYSVEDGIDEPDAQIKYPLTFLDRINSPDKLTAVLNSDLYDNFTQTGIFNREELDETFSAIARLLFKIKPTGYPFDPRLKDALRTFVERWQNPKTGCWGQWLVDRDGRVWKMDDMGITFHVVSDLNGNVGHLDKIAKRLLQLENSNFPAGIRFDGHYENHLNWDAVKILRLAWPSLDEPTRVQARAAISRMLNWCLKQSYRPDGSFKTSELDDTVGDAFQYGVNFLREVGYFNPQKRFWTDQKFNGANAVRDKIAAKLQQIGLNDPGLKSAFAALQNEN